MAQESLKSLEERMDEQLHAFGYGASEEETRGNRSGRLVGAAAVGTAGALGFAKRKQIAHGAGAGLEKAGDMLRRKATLGPRAAVLNPNRMRKAAGQAGDVLLRGAKKLKGFGEVSALIELAERVAELELEAEEELIEFGRMDDMRAKAKGYAGQAKAGYGKARKAGMSMAAGAGARAADGAALLKKYPGRAGGIAGGVAALAGAGAYGMHRHKKAKRRDELLARFKSGKAE
jgi:hypothetical protein